MDNQSNGIGSLSPKRKQLFALLLKESGIGATQRNVISRGSGPGPWPLSSAQQRLWFLQQLNPDDVSYNLLMPIKLKGCLNQAALLSSLREIVRRHEILRTRFPRVGTRAVQVVSERVAVPFLVVDLTRVPEAEKGEEINRWLRTESTEPFDLVHGPVLRCLLFKATDDEHILLFTIHHIVIDGWSIGILFGELSVLYAAFDEERHSPLEELSIQYADYCVWEQQSIESGSHESQLAYWKKQLANAPGVLECLTDITRSGERRGIGVTESIEIDNRTYELLKALSSRARATLFMTLLAAFKLLLHRYTAREDILVTTGTAGRGRVELERLIGLFVNLLVMRTDLGGNPSCLEVVDRVRRVALEAYANQDTPFQHVANALAAQPSESKTRLFEIVFLLEKAAIDAIAMPGLAMSGVDVGPRIVNVDLNLFITERDNGLTATVRYNSDLFSAGTMKRFLNHYEIILQSFASQWETRILDISLPQVESSGSVRREVVLQKEFSSHEFSF